MNLNVSFKGDIVRRTWILITAGDLRVKWINKWIKVMASYLPEHTCTTVQESQTLENCQWRAPNGTWTNPKQNDTESLKWTQPPSIFFKHEHYVLKNLYAVVLTSRSNSGDSLEDNVSAAILSIL